LACLPTLAGCKEVQYRAATTHDEVVAITTKTVPSGQNAEVKVDGTHVRVDVQRVCNLVEEKEVSRRRVSKPDESVFLEAMLMGLSSVPMTAGIIALADAPNVYDRDSNSRLYNPTGKSSATALGTVGVTLGLAMFVPATVAMIRKTKPKVEQSTVQVPGDTVQLGVACRDQNVGDIMVSGVFDTGTHATLGYAGQDGTLSVDLVSLLTPSMLGGANEPTTLTIRIGSQSYGLVDLSPALEVHAARRSKAWYQAEPERCDQERTEQACAGVRQFVATFPNSRQAAEGKVLLSNIGKVDAKSPHGRGVPPTGKPNVQKVAQ
jgi:hypothetical protein